MPASTRAVIAIHGLSRNADDYWGYAAAGLEGVSGVLLVAPQFAASDDDPASDQLYWSELRLVPGRPSPKREGRPWSISSFDVLDELVASLRRTFVEPAHGGRHRAQRGGQMTQRYAAASDDPAALRGHEPRLIPLPEPRASDGERLASPTPDPPAGYDDYKYGLQALKTRRTSQRSARTSCGASYEAARVTYLLGERDTDPEDPDLD